MVLMARNRWHRFGYACVNFGTPIAMKEWVARRGLDFRALEKEERFAALGGLAAELMAAIGAVIPVLPVPLVATVFLARPAERLSELEVKAAALDLMTALADAGALVYLPRQDREYAIAAGLRMLVQRHLVEEADGFYAARPEEAALLGYYASSIAHLVGRTPAVPATREADRAYSQGRGER
jgi:glycerol-3-phosphate O-acyltransferase